ncbi:MAG: uroporphyrinogen decarboxylase [Rickettsiales bacterium]|nr:uroporphyrinogen decarboxylase [Rickettsiales bacterium]
MMGTKPFLKTLKGIKNEIPPVWFMRQAGRYLPEYREIRSQCHDFLEMCYTPKLACEITLQPIRRFAFDAAILFSDILVVPDAMGVKTTFIKGRGPVLEAVTSLQSFKQNVKDIDPFLSHLEPVFEAIRLIKTELNDQTALIGFAGSPWTVATYMLEGGSSKDFKTIKQFMFSEEEAFTDFIDILTEYTAQYLLKQIEAGVEAVQLFDSWSGILGKDEFYRYSILPNQKIVSIIRKHYPEFPIIGFPKGASIYYPDYAKQTVVTALGVDFSMDMKWIVDHVPSNIVVQGNLDPIVLLGNQEMIKRKISYLLDVTSKRPFIFNLGHGIVPQTSIENVEYALKLIRES